MSEPMAQDDALGNRCECGEVEAGQGHFCMSAHDFVGDEIMGALEWEMEYGDRAPEGGDE